MSETIPMPPVDQTPRLFAADQVFEHLRQQIMSLELPPGTKMSEAEVALQTGLSRQPVRDAFYRLSKLGFLTIRPQRATTVSRISMSAVVKARFIRASLEIEVVRVAAEVLTPSDFEVLADLILRQQEAIGRDDRTGFHDLDDLFHKEIASRSGHGFAWELIRENKAHMDRVRLLSLSFASQIAHDEHVAIFEAMRARDGDGAAAAMREHLSRILVMIHRIRAQNSQWFETEDGLS